MILNRNVIFSQQSSLYNTYSIDPLLLNIAYAGSSCKEINAHYRTQWIGMPNAPKAMQLNAHSAFGKSNGIAFRINSQTIGLLDKLDVTLGYSYKFKISKYSKLHFGIGIGWDQTVFNSNKAIVLSNKDVNLNNFNQQKAQGIDSEFGLMLISKISKIGFSILHLYNSKPDYSGNGTFKTLPQVNLQGSYVFNKGKKVEIEPWILNRYTLKGNNVLEGVVNFNIDKSLTIGAGYRSNYGIIFLASFKIENFKIAYSADYGTSKNAINLGSSHQIMLGYSLCSSANNIKKKFYKLIGGDDRSQKEEAIGFDSIVVSTKDTLAKTKTDAIVLLDTKNDISSDVSNEDSLNKIIKPSINDSINNSTAKNDNVILKNDTNSLSLNQPEIISKTETDSVSSISEISESGMTKEDKKYEIQKQILKKINNISMEVVFKINEAQLDNDILKKLDEIAEVIKSNRDLKINIIGYASKTGTKQFNDILSIRRANYIRQELLKRGVKKRRFNRTIGSGYDETLFGNSPDAEEKSRTIRFDLVN
jgi:type IX secretion system PorP/SprF family membrane protein